MFDAAALREDWGVGPDQVVDFQALVGDKVDNVPGVPGIGPKTAQALLETYGTLDNLLDHAAEVPGAKGKTLVEYRETALLSRELVRLDSHVPIVPDWDASRVGGMDHARLAELFRRVRLPHVRRTRGRARAEPRRAGPAAAASGRRIITSSIRRPSWPISSQLLLEQAADQRRHRNDARLAALRGRSSATRSPSSRARRFTCRSAGRPAIPCSIPSETLEALRPVLENPAIGKIGQNLKYDMIVLRSVGVKLAGVAFDTMVASYLLDAGGRSHNLDDLAQQYLDHTTIKIDQLIGKGREPEADGRSAGRAGGHLRGRGRRRSAAHACRFWPRAGRDGARQSSTKRRSAADRSAGRHGIHRRPRRPRAARPSSARVTASGSPQLEQEIEELAGHPLNIGSPKQLAQVLFQELRLPVVKKTKTGPSTDADVLEQLAESHPLPAKIVEYRQYAKLKNTYVDALPTMIHPETGRVHASFNQVVAATGRLSSSDPNLQNIPIRTEEGREIRSAFVAGPRRAGSCWPPTTRRSSCASWPTTRKTRRCAPRSTATRTSTRSWPARCSACRSSEVTSAMRRSAKAVNFGVIYGQSPFGLAKGLGISQEEAAKFIDGYFATYRGVAEFMLRTLDECRRNGLRVDDPRPPPRDPGRSADRPAHARHRAPQPPAAQPAGAHGRQHA